MLYQQILLLGCLPLLLSCYFSVLSAARCFPLESAPEAASQSQTLVSEEPPPEHGALLWGRTAMKHSPCWLVRPHFGRWRVVGLQASPCKLRVFPWGSVSWKDLRQALPEVGQGGSERWSVLEGELLEGTFLYYAAQFQVLNFYFHCRGGNNKEERSPPLQSSPWGLTVQCWFLERWGRSPRSRREFLIRATLAHWAELAGSRWKRLLNTAIELP